MLKVALTNLGKYNEGSLVYTWLELPATEEEIDAAMDEIGVAPGTEYEEYFISDYEAPFNIDEYASLSQLNRIAEALEGLNIPEAIFSGTYVTEEVIDLAYELESAGYIDDAAEYVGDIINTNDLDEMVADIAKESGWERVKFFLAGISDISADYYRINGYGNAEDITRDYLDCIVSDLLHELWAVLDEEAAA